MYNLILPLRSDAAFDEPLNMHEACIVGLTSTSWHCELGARCISFLRPMSLTVIKRCPSVGILFPAERRLNDLDSASHAIERGTAFLHSTVLTNVLVNQHSCA